MTSINIPIELELTPRSRALIDALVQAGTPVPDPKSEPPAAATPPAIGEYWPGQGGIYCGVLPAIGGRPAMHMVFSKDETTRTWGPYGEEFPGAKSRHDGRANTQALYAAGRHGKDWPAAIWAATYEADGHKDYHLPSQAELFMASLHAPQVFNKEGWYWSSTQNLSVRRLRTGLRVRQLDLGPQGRRAPGSGRPLDSPLTLQHFTPFPTPGGAAAPRFFER